MPYFSICWLQKQVAPSFNFFGTVSIKRLLEARTAPFLGLQLLDNLCKAGVGSIGNSALLEVRPLFACLLLLRRLRQLGGRRDGEAVAHPESAPVEEGVGPTQG